MGVVTRRGTNVPAILKKIYTDLRNPASFSSPYRLYSEAKKFNSKIKLKGVINSIKLARDAEIVHFTP